jgi:hypothetical protein
VGLSLLGADAADGSISIADARTFGVDILSLARQVTSRAEEHDEMLRPFDASAADRESN